MRTCLTAAATLCLISLAACGMGDGRPAGLFDGDSLVPIGSSAPVASISVTSASSTVAVGDSVRLSVVLRDANGRTLAGRPVSYSSSNNQVATVSGIGVVKAHKAGNASITATSELRSASTQLQVTP